VIGCRLWTRAPAAVPTRLNSYQSECDLGREEVGGGFALRYGAAELDRVEFDVRAGVAEGPRSASLSGAVQVAGLGVPARPFVHGVGDDDAVVVGGQREWVTVRSH
jgi:hypothetical protein